MDSKKDKNPTLTFLVDTKRKLQESDDREDYDLLLEEISRLLVNTSPRKQTIDQTEPTMVLLAIPKGNGQNDFISMPRVQDRKGGESDVPRAEIPIAFSKIVTASSVISGAIPDGQVFSVNKIKARLHYELWKRTWAEVDMNGLNTLDFGTQQLIMTGTGAWRIYPRRVVIDKTYKGTKSKKVIYDDLYREPLDMSRTWLGMSYRPYSDDGRPEVLWEIDITNDDYAKLKRQFNKRTKRTVNAGQLTKDIAGMVSKEAEATDPNIAQTHTTIQFYENPKDNRYIIASPEISFYDGEIPNDEVYGSIVVGHCFHKDMISKYGVGVWELIRGNATIQNYIQSLNVEQVAAEIYPIMFGSGTLQGDMTLKRSPNYLNILPAGMKVDKITSTGNSTLGMNLVKVLQQENDSITGINDIISGVNGADTLGETVLLKEAALSRLTKPRNSIARMLEKDFSIASSWFEQDQINPREFIFASPEEVQAFQKLNPMHSSDVTEESDVDASDSDNDIDNDSQPSPDDGSSPTQVAGENGVQPTTQPTATKKYRVLSSPRVPVSFDYSKLDLEESGYDSQDLKETGQRNILIPRSTALRDVQDLESDDKIGYDKVIIKIDQTSMLIPSIEIEKQNSMQLYPIVQNALMQIFGLARTDPEQAKAQLISFDKFLKTQRQNVYDYIPKDLFDQIMSGEMTPPPAPPLPPGAGPGGPGGPVPLGPDNTPVGSPQHPNEMPQVNPVMGQSFNGGINKLPAKVAISAKGNGR